MTTSLKQSKFQKTTKPQGPGPPKTVLRKPQGLAYPQTGDQTVQMVRRLLEDRKSRAKDHGRALRPLGTREVRVIPGKLARGLPATEGGFGLDIYAQTYSCTHFLSGLAQTCVDLLFTN